ncbi:hypothetical protein FHS03_005068 [Massilia violacea]|uniref:Uncharacterized protein n=1 Tax=Pseudoduganella violacea TaxID=1715466 RepID=A0A7W5FX76_9BURK|nr:hypothetical protein [Pseudoduganella violacea]
MTELLYSILIVCACLGLGLYAFLTLMSRLQSR